MIGTTRIHKGQRYTAVASLERTRRDGSTALILRWVSACAQCGAPFEITTPAASSKFEPNRRCAKHKRPGQRVKEVVNHDD
jgi:hypothetical protein